MYREGTAIDRSGNGAGCDRGQSDNDCESERFHGYLLWLGLKRFVSSGPPEVCPWRFRVLVMAVRRGDLKYRPAPKSIEKSYSRDRNDRPIAAPALVQTDAYSRSPWNA